MYDLDQRRDPLPNDGNMYCVPASFADVCAYLKKYGNNFATGGYSPADYDDMTNLLFTLGVIFFTDPYDGTSGSKPAEVAWIDSHTTKLVFFGSYGPSSTWSYRTIMNQFRNGALVRMAYGRYKLQSGAWNRYSGHSVALAGHQRHDSGQGPNQFFVADPAADDGDLNAQGSFIFQIKDTSDITLTTADFGVVTHARYTNWTGGGGDRRAVVDSMLAVLPVYAGWPAVEGDSTTFTIKIPWQMNPSTTHQDFPTQVQFSTSDSVADWAFDQADFGVIYITPSGAVRRYDIATGVTTTLMTSAAAQKVAIGGPDMDVFVLREGVLFDSISRVARKDGRIISHSLSSKAAGFDIDDTTGGIVALSNDLKTVTEFDADFSTWKVTKLFELSTVGGTPISAGGSALFSIDQGSGDYFVSAQGSNSWVRYPKALGVRKGVRTTIRGTVDRLVPGPQRAMFVQDSSDRIWTYTLGGLPMATDFNGMQAAGEFRVARSFTMQRAGETVGPGWINELPVGDEP